MKFCLDKSLFSSNKDLIIDSKSYYWSDTQALYDLDIQGINQFLSLYKIDEVSFLDKKYLKMINSLNIESPDWKNLLPTRVYVSYKRELQEKIKFLKDFFANEKYSQFFSNGNSILNRLVPANIDKKKLEYFIEQESNKNLRSILSSFSSIKDPVKYDRLKTVTGRLVVKSGPQFLLLPKEYKPIIKSYYGKNGVIAWVDFVSLEPRFAKLSVENTAPDDIYEDIILKNSFDFDRKTTKGLVLATIFGAGVNKLSEVAGKDAFIVQKAISKYFGFNQILEKAGDYNTGIIKNFFGRPIKLKKRAKNIAINNYIQSSSVDVALIGFSNLKLPTSSRPLAVVHDALVIDLLKSDLPKLNDIINKGIEIDGLGHFRLGVELL